MRKIKEVLRLRFELGLGQRAIARACSISQSTVHEYLQRAAAASVVWPLSEDWDEQRLNQALFGELQPPKRLPEHVLPDSSFQSCIARERSFLMDYVKTRKITAQYDLEDFKRDLKTVLAGENR
jgi:hypothetical protein